MRIRAIETYRSQTCWVCGVTLMVTTVEQFTDEEHTVIACGKYMVTSLIKGYMKARKIASMLRAKPGERAAKGWS